MIRSQHHEDRRRRPDYECPVSNCKKRYLDAEGAGRHLVREHSDAGRWQSDRYTAVDGVDESDLVIYDKTNGEAWIQSSFFVEVGEDES